MNKLIQINTCVIILLLVSTSLGFYNSNFIFLRWYTFLSALISGYILFKSRDMWWFGAFITIALVFNPFFNLVTLTKDAWKLIDVITAAMFTSFLYHYYDYYRKGVQFENYISKLFPEDIWVITDRTKDYSKKLNRIVESDTNPDFTFRHIASGKIFAVECKYHSYLSQGKYGDYGIWWKKQQGDRYEIYGKRNKIPVFVAIGIAGSSFSPKRLFLCPLEKLNSSKYEFITESELKKYEKKIGREFMLESFQ